MKEPLFLSRGEGIYRLWLIDYVPDRIINSQSDERLYPRQLRFILAEINQLNTTSIFMVVQAEYPKPKLNTYGGSGRMS
jgi:hypothetical protein